MNFGLGFNPINSAPILPFGTNKPGIPVNTFHIPPTVSIESTTHDDTIKLETDLIKQITIQSKKANKIQNDDHLIIFIHGYNNNINEINKRGNKIDITLGTKKVITTSFNWKSYGKKLKYYGDKQQAKNCAKHFIKYVENLRNNKQFKKIDIIAHSMGNYLLCKSILLCDTNNKLNLFKNMNIICLAADVELNEYEYTINKIKSYVKSWLHYYNPFDFALIASNAANKLTYRAGQCECNISFVKSIKWPASLLNGHGYIDDIFNNNKKLSYHILNELQLNTTVNINSVQDDFKDDLLFNGNQCGSGDVWWDDIESHYSDQYGILKLQQHKSACNNTINFVRKHSFWSNHNDKYRIIYGTKNNKQKIEWKEIYHSSNSTEAENKFVTFLSFYFLS